MLRDKHKDEEYFQNGTLQVLSVANQEREYLRKNPNAKEIAYYMFANSLGYYIPRAYSLGLPINQLINSCEQMIDAYIKSLEFTIDYADGGDIIYSELLSMISLGILLDTHKQLGMLSESLSKVNYRDAIIDFLLNFSRQSQRTEVLLWPEDAASKKLKEIIFSEKPAAELAMKEYLENYYYTKENLEDSFNSHKRNNNDYDGYWSFESAAIVKIMGLDDSTFKDSPYYPYDMLYEDRSIQKEYVFPLVLPVKNDSIDDAIVNEPLGKKKKWWQF